MNESRYNMFWIYVLDMHNHHSIGDIRHAINPTSPYRMQMIVDSAIAASIAAKVHVAGKEAVGVEIPRPDGASGDEVPRVDGAGGSEVPREDELASLLSGMDIGHESEDASLKKYVSVQENVLQRSVHAFPPIVFVMNCVTSTTITVPIISTHYKFYPILLFKKKYNKIGSRF